MTVTWTPDHSVRFAIQLQSAVEECAEGGIPFPIIATLVSRTGAVVVLKFLQRGDQPLTLVEREETQEWALPAAGVFVGYDPVSGDFGSRIIKFDTTEGVFEAIRAHAN